MKRIVDDLWSDDDVMVVVAKGLGLGRILKESVVKGKKMVCLNVKAYERGLREVAVFVTGSAEIKY